MSRDEKIAPDGAIFLFLGKDKGKNPNQKGGFGHYLIRLF